MTAIPYVASSLGLGQFQAAWFLLDWVYISPIRLNMSSPTKFSTERRLGWHSSTVVSRCILSKPGIGEAGVSRRELWKSEFPQFFFFQTFKKKHPRTYGYIHSVRSFSSIVYVPTVVPCTSETLYILRHVRPLTEMDFRELGFMGRKWMKLAQKFSHFIYEHRFCVNTLD